MSINVSKLFFLPLCGTFLLGAVNGSSWDDSKGPPPLRRSYAQQSLFAASPHPFSLDDRDGGDSLQRLHGIAKPVLDDNELDSILASLSIQLSLNALDIPDNSPEFMTLRGLLQQNPIIAERLDIHKLTADLLQQPDTRSRLDIIQKFFS